MNEKIIARINKLMALTQSSNENESAKAAEMALKLMEENGISTKDLDIANLEADLGPIDREALNESTYVSAWEKNLAYTIAQYFNCVTYIQNSYRCKNWKKRKMYAVGFVGHESNRITAMTMYEWLRKAINREARQKFTQYANQMSFCLGAANAIGQKYAEVKKDESNEAGLVIYDEVQNWIDNHMNMKEGRASRSLSVSSAAYNAGKVAGGNYSLNRQFGLKAIGC